MLTISQKDFFVSLDDPSFLRAGRVYGT